LPGKEERKKKKREFVALVIVTLYSGRGKNGPRKGWGGKSRMVACIAVKRENEKSEPQEERKKEGQDHSRRGNSMR